MYKYEILNTFFKIVYKPETCINQTWWDFGKKTELKLDEK